MYQLDVLQNQWLVLAIFGGISLVGLVVLLYEAIWRPRQSSEGEAVMQRSILTLVAFAVLVGRPARSFADRQEWQLSPVGIVGASSSAQGGQRSWAFAGGAGLRAAYGITDFFELGVQAHFTTSQQLVVPNAVINGQPGNLVGDEYAVELAIDLRLIGDVHVSRAFARVHPLLGARAGGLVRIFTSQVLVDDQNLLILRPDNSVSILPSVTGYGGLEYRFARTWLAGLVGSFTYAGPSYYAAGASLEISWMTY